MYATLASGFSQRAVLAGQDNNGQWGPTGLAFAADGALLVANYHDGNLYRVGPDGADDPEPLLRDLRAVGLVSLPDGRVLASRTDDGAVVEIELEGRRIGRRYPCPLGGPVGLAIDPLSERVLVTLLRQHALAWLSPDDGRWELARQGAPLDRPDGLAFDSGGNAYVGSVGNDRVVRLAWDGALQELAAIPGEPDGIAVAGPRSPLQGAVLVSCHSGDLWRVDFDGEGWFSSRLAGGGTRGDHLLIGPDGHLYVTQTDEVVQIGPPVFLEAPADPNERRDFVTDRLA